MKKRPKVITNYNIANSSSQSPRHQAFTLIELLTVIAIIAILTAILIPAVGSARLQAQKAETTSQLRQVHAAVMLCTSDNKGILPGPAFSGVKAGYREVDNYSLTRLISSYLTVTLNSEYPEYSTVEELLPSNYEELAANYEPKKKGPCYRLNEHYTTGMFQPFGYPQSGEDEQINPSRLIQIPDNARNVMIYAIDQQNVPNSPGWASDIPVSPLFGNLRPFLYWDGHIVLTESNSPEDDLSDQI